MAFDGFVQFDGIEGESTDSNHTGWVEVIDYDHVMTQPVSESSSSTGARASERATHGTFNITKGLDKTSPKLAVYLNQGSNISKVRVELCRATGDKTCYMVYEMTDVLVQEITVNGDITGERTVPTEIVALNYGNIEWTYTVTDKTTGAAQGDISGKWSVTDNAGG